MLLPESKIPVERLMVRLFNPLVTAGKLVLEVYSPKVMFDDDPPVRLPEFFTISWFNVIVLLFPIEKAPLFKVSVPFRVLLKFKFTPEESMPFS